MDIGKPDLFSYDVIVVAFSGGKDSLACVLHLLEMGVPLDRIELQHHEVDGRESPAFMDWPVTPAYCRAVSEALGLRILFSWKEGGFEREMLRNNTPTAPTHFETSEHGLMTMGGESGKLGTRLKFPQVAASLSCRWCSAYLKIDVLDKVLGHGPEYQNKRVLVVTGERAEESANRARYQVFEHGRAHAPKRGRFVDHWRPVHGWTTAQVWEIIQRHGIVPHPAYYLGWGRLSCLSCIFGSPNQWATIRAIAPERFEKIRTYEERFGLTINRKKSVVELAGAGRPYAAALESRAMVASAMGTIWSDHENGPIKVPSSTWVLPTGAFGENSGPA